MCTRLMPGDMMLCNLREGTVRFFRPRDETPKFGEVAELYPLYRATPVIGMPFDTMYIKKPNRGAISDAEITDVVWIIATAVGLEIESAKRKNADLFDRWFVFRNNARAGKIIEQLNAAEPPLMDGSPVWKTVGR